MEMFVISAAPGFHSYCCWFINIQKRIVVNVFMAGAAPHLDHHH